MVYNRLEPDSYNWYASLYLPTDVVNLYLSLNCISREVQFQLCGILQDIRYSFATSFKKMPLLLVLRLS